MTKSEALNFVRDAGLKPFIADVDDDGYIIVWIHNGNVTTKHLVKLGDNPDFESIEVTEDDNTGKVFLGIGFFGE